MLFYVWPVPLVAIYTFQQRRNLIHRTVFFFVALFMCYGVLATMSASAMLTLGFLHAVESPLFLIQVVILMFAEIALAIAMLSKLRSAWKVNG